MANMLPFRQLRSLLHKNLLQKLSAPTATLFELCLPVGFMMLLVYFKTLASIFDSPTVAYVCGNTEPWLDFPHTTPDPFTCNVIPDACAPPQGIDNYYQSEVDGSKFYPGVGKLYTNYGYTPSAKDQGYPAYGVQIGDDTFPRYNPAQPSPSVEIMLEMFSGGSDGGINHTKLAITYNTTTTDVEDNEISAKSLAYNYYQYLRKASDDNVNLVFYEDGESSMEDYITGSEYDTLENLSDKISFAIVFHDSDIANHEFDYSIRTNVTVGWQIHLPTTACMTTNCKVPSSSGPDGSGLTSQFVLPTTTLFTDDITHPQSSGNYFGYAYSGFLGLQKATDAYLMSFSSSLQEITLQSSLSLMPTNSYRTDNFTQAIGGLLPIFYMLAFLYPFSRYIRGLVIEKEQKIKEGMLMMGLHGWVYYLSWFITLGIQGFISSMLITLSTGTVFSYSGSGFIFMYFFSFSVSVIMMSFLLSTFFSRAKTSAIMGTLLFFASYFPYYAVVDPAFSPFIKLMVSLFSPSAFALGAGVLSNYESAQIGITSDTWTSVDGNYSYFYSVFMMLFDSFLYAFGSWYLGQVLPSEYGTQRPWHFPISMWWGAKPGARGDGAYEPLLDIEAAAIRGNANVKTEPVPSDLKSLIAENRALSIKNLRKVYKTTGDDRVAVDGLNLDLFEGQITVLLGHNGAGKSTTISMITGLINSTSGDAIVRGRSVTSEMRNIRKSMGVCPQHDVLFSDLTVRQHLHMFAVFKNVDSREIASAVENIIDEVGLNEKADVKSSNLSGGMKRKLSVGIALIGDSKVVILDEPTSGMDPFSRRSTWSILQKNKAGRIILLTTHFMDEADILGDRIAIMAGGRLQCVGSSIFLKHTYGVGYTLTVVREDGNGAGGGSEQGIREKIDEQYSGEKVDALVKKYIPSAEVLSFVGAEQSYRLPFNESKKFVGLFEQIEREKEKMGVSSYGVSVTTLEEVFMRVGHGSEESNLDETKKLSFEKSTAGIEPSEDDFMGTQEAFRNEKTGMVAESKVFFVHTKALLKKRMIYGMRDKKSFCFQLVIPTILVLLGLVLLTVRDKSDLPSIDLLYAGSNFNEKFSPIERNPMPVYVDGDNHDLDELVLNLGRDKEIADAFLITEEAQETEDQFYGCAQGAKPLIDMSNWLIDRSGASSIYNGVIFSDTSNASSGLWSYNLMINASNLHGPAVAMNVVNSAILQTITNSTNARIVTRNYPLPNTESENRANQTADAFTASMMVMIAFCFLPASYAIFVVKEREVKAKHQQIISGVSLSAYWFSTWLWDATSYLAPFSLTLALVYAFGIESYTKGDGAMACALLFLLFGPAVAGFTYVSSFLFKSHSTAQNLILFQNFVTGLCLMITSFILGLFDSTRLVNMKLKNLYRLFPGFCLGDGLIQLTLCNDDICPVLGEDGYELGTTQGVYAWDVVGGDLAFLGLEIVGYLALTCLIEYALSFPSLLGVFERCWEGGSGRRREDEVDTGEDDKDVAAERRRVEGGGGERDVVVLRNLRKVYRGGKVAVKNLSFGIPNGECFGFLGINGAGKTTTLSILSGEFSPTSGGAWIDGKDIKGDQSLIRRKIGYCPQFDALLELLTVEEHLELYSRIKGVEKSKLKNVVECKLREMDLLDFRDKSAGSLSGGNKRKLSVAIAMIGFPSIVFLDEPSTGMDPVARRFMWDVISRMSTRDGKCSIILTTHSMEEAEALCSRIGIMVAGRLRCLGSGQHLKNRFGNGYEVEVKMKGPIEGAILDLFSRLRSVFGIGEKMDGHGLRPSLAAVDEKFRLDASDLGAVCGVLGKKDRMHEIRPGGRGELIWCQMEVAKDKRISVVVFLEWWIVENQFSNLDEFLGQNFGEVVIIERSTVSSCKYQIVNGRGGGK